MPNAVHGGVRRCLRMVHSVVVQPALLVRATLGPSPTDLCRALLRLDLENQQVLQVLSPPLHP